MLDELIRQTICQAAGMLAHILIQQLSYYLLGCTFIVLSLANVLIKRGRYDLKTIRIPALILIIATSTDSFLLIPCMDYLRETALLEGMPVALSRLASYYATLNILTLALVIKQIISSSLIAWRFGKPYSV